MDLEKIYNLTEEDLYNALDDATEAYMNFERTIYIGLPDDEKNVILSRRKTEVELFGFIFINKIIKTSQEKEKDNEE